MEAIRESVYRAAARAGCAVAVSAVLTAGLGARTARAQTSQDHDGQTAKSAFLLGSAAYNGYWSGFARGADDSKKVESEFTPQLDVTYLCAVVGYEQEMGPFFDYRRAFRTAYVSGYAASHSGRAGDPTAHIPPVPLGPDYGIVLGLRSADPSDDGDDVGVARAKGYENGYAQGTADTGRGRSYGYGDAAVYRAATDGYEVRFGDEPRYRDVFRSTYSRGYSDGYNGRARFVDDSIRVDADRPAQVLRAEDIPDAGSLTSADVRAGRSIESSLGARQATGTGYHVGYERGHYDSRNGVRTVSLQKQDAYRLALDGWSAKFGARSVYQTEFRKSFLLGYDDGFNGRSPTIASPKE